MSDSVSAAVGKLAPEPGLPLSWDRWQRRALILAAAAMAAVAAAWLGYQFWRLLWQPETLAGRPVHPGAIDLLERYDETTSWFRSLPVLNPVYPPASYLLLWPFLGWLSSQAAIALWAATSLLAAAWLVALTVRESGVTSLPARVCVALLPLAMYATGATIGNGQLNVHLMPLLVAGILLLRQEPVTARRDWAGSLLVLGSLVKPNISAPFFWIVALALRRWRPALIVVVGYVALTLAAAPFRPDSLAVQLRNWLSFSAGSAYWSSAVSREVVNSWPMQLSINPQQYVLSLLHLQQWATAVSLGILAALGVWIYRRRDADSWLLLGVSGVAARFWTYHRWYDDIVMLLPMIAMLRLVAADARPGVTPSRLLLVAAVLTTLAPGGLYVLPPPWLGVYVVTQIAVWLLLLRVIADAARQQVARPQHP